MKSRTLACSFVPILFVLLAIPVRVTAQQHQSEKLPRYFVTDLGTLGGTFSVGRGINAGGNVVGSAALNDNTAQHAFMWQKGLITDLGTLGGPNSIAFLGPNEADVVPGEAETSTPDPLGEDFCFFGTRLTCLPFVWQNGVMTALPTLGGNNGSASAINNRGQVGGLAENATLDSTCSSPENENEAVIWDKGVPKPLPTVAGDPDGYVNAINDNGDAVGGSGNCFSGPTFSLHAVLWQNGKPTDLGSLGGALFSGGIGINDRGLVTGSSDLPGDTTFFAGPFINTHAFLWKSGAIKDLGTLPGDAVSFSQAINNRGQVVGFGSRAILWQDGKLIDLNTLVPGPPFSPMYLLQALDISVRGEIVGIGLTINGDIHGFLAVPCDENHADVEGCKDGAAAGATVESSATSGRSPVSVTQVKLAPGGRWGTPCLAGTSSRCRGGRQLPILGNWHTRWP